MHYQQTWAKCNFRFVVVPSAYRYLSSCHQTASDTNLLDDPHTFHYNDYFVIGGICTCLGVSDDPTFLWISSNSCPLNLLLVQSHKVEIIIVKRLIQGRNNMTRVRVEPRSFDKGHRKNDAFIHSATLPTTHSATLPTTHLATLSTTHSTTLLTTYSVMLPTTHHIRPRCQDMQFILCNSLSVCHILTLAYRITVLHSSPHYYLFE